MKHGFVGSYGSPAQLVAGARLAEQHGWDGWFSWDATSLGGMACWDPWSLLAAAAVTTERITLGALVFALPKRSPWELAQQSLTVDHLSGGRLVLPVGLGVGEDAGLVARTGSAPGRRQLADALDDHLDLLDRAWSGEPFRFEGRTLDVPELHFPEPPVRGRIPVWPVAITGTRSLRRAARWDGVVLQLAGDRAQDPLRPEDVTAALVDVAAHRDADAGPFELIAQVDGLATDLGLAAENAAALEQAGATWLIEAGWDPIRDTPEKQTDRLRRGPAR